MGLCCETDTPSQLTWLDYPSQQWSIVYTPGSPFPTVEYCLHPLDYPSQQWSIVYTPWITLPNSGVLFTPTGSFLEAGTCFLVSVSCCGYIDVVIRACCFVKNTCTHLTVLLYVSHFVCVYCVQFDVESDFARNGFAAA